MRIKTLTIGKEFGHVVTACNLGIRIYIEPHTARFSAAKFDMKRKGGRDCLAPPFGDINISREFDHSSSIVPGGLDVRS